MAHEIYLIDPELGDVHLSGAGVKWDGSGLPWNDRATSPYKLSTNQVTGNLYTPQAPTPVEIWRGGPPFRVGSDLSFRGYGNVDEPVGIQMYGASHDAVVGLERRLRWALSRPTPAVLAVRPDGASQTVYYEILSARIQETPDFIHGEHRTPEQLAAGAVAMMRATIQWRRTPFGGNRGTWETLVNGATVGNTGTGSPDNLEALGVQGTGDLIYEGSPLNVVLSVSGEANSQLLIATCAGRTYLNTSDSLVTSDTSESGAAIATHASAFNAASFVTNRRLRLRMLGRVTNASATLQVSVRLYAQGSLVYTSPWVTATTSGGSNVLLDFGGTALPMYYRTLITGSALMQLEVRARSTTGAATTGVLDYLEFVPYYTFGIARRAPDSTTIIIEQFVQRSGLPALPIPVRASGSDSGNFTSRRTFVGAAPVYISGAQLYLAWRIESTNAHNAAATQTLTVTHAPLFQTLRGGGS